MEIRVSPASQVDIAVAGQDGWFWSAPSYEGSLIIEQLLATQDCTITLGAVSSTETVFYTMGGDHPSAVRRTCGCCLLRASAL